MAKKGAAGRSRLFFVVALAVLAVQLLPEVEVSHLADGDSAFALLPMSKEQSHGSGTQSAELGHQKLFVSGAMRGSSREGAAGSRTARRAAPAAAASISAKVLNAMGAGAVASVIQAVLSAVGEPIVNRVLVKRMKLMDAINDVKPSMMLEYLKTTLATNFLKFPFFEAINALCAALPINPSVRGIVTGFVFTTATLPVTNFRYRKSMQLEVKWGNIYEAYWPTVIRDIVYGICRNYCTIWTLAAAPGWKATSPQVLFIVVILGCLGSAPFNEWRGFLLQAKGQELSFKDFFKPSNFVRSTGLGAFKQGIALALGYWCAPPVTKFVNGLLGR
mmetsp:Transcript_38891/g.67283  ORF Transcript_38891/g.67283 Transcript_38891/m.67283 type:complete len:332 (-) Transcript_38891:190-1185(-)